MKLLLSDKLLTGQLVGRLEEKCFLMYSSICVLPNLCEKLTKRFLSQIFNPAPEMSKLLVHFCVLPFSHKDYTTCFAKFVDVKQSKEENDDGSEGNKLEEKENQVIF